MKNNFDEEHLKLQKIWSNYWKHYNGVTKIGKWSQIQSVNIALKIIKDIKLKKTLSIIDIGCGEGRTMQFFKKNGYNNIIGLDFSIESLNVCKSNGLVLNRDIFLADVAQTKYKKNEFDVVFSEGLLEHYKDPSPIIKEMSRISGKYILLIQPSPDSLYGFIISVLGNILRGNVKEYFFTESYYKKEFKKLDFECIITRKTLLGEFLIMLFKRE